jgi:diguanylate cyclase (GGDEF)-like protein
LHLIGEKDNAIRLLLIGNPELRPDGLERGLLRAGFEIVEESAESPARTGDIPSAVLVTLPDATSAASVLQRLRDDAPLGVPVLIMLASGDGATRTRLLEEGATDVLTPPMDVPEIIARIAARIRGSREVISAIRLSREASELFDVLQEVSAGLRSEDTLHTLVCRLGEVLGLAHSACLFWTPSQSDARLMAVHEDPKVRDVPVNPEHYPEAVEAVRSGVTVFVKDVARHPLFLAARERGQQSGLYGVRSAVGIPLLRHGRALGAIVLRSPLMATLGVESLRFAERLVRATTRVLETQERRAAIRRRQTGAADALDPLTACPGLDALDRRLKEEFERSRRYGLSFSLVLLDVDGLAGVNERFGNEAGDRILADLGAILQREIRGPDFVARYGGDEFALVLPVTSLEGARQSIMRVRERVHQHPFADLPTGQHLGISAGLITFPHPAAVHSEDLFALAESALIRAKSPAGNGIGVGDPVGIEIGGRN